MWLKPGNEVSKDEGWGGRVCKRGVHAECAVAHLGGGGQAAAVAINVRAEAASGSNPARCLDPAGVHPKMELRGCVITIEGLVP